MSSYKQLTQAKRELQLGRMSILAPMMLKGHTKDEMMGEVVARTGRDYSTATFYNDKKKLLKEWQESARNDIDSERTIALARIDALIKEAWRAYEKSCRNWTDEVTRRKGVPVAKGDNGENSIATVAVESTTREIRGEGNVKYLDLIARLIAERNKIVGVYAPVKQEVSGDLFSQMLMMTSEEGGGSGTEASSSGDPL